MVKTYEHSSGQVIRTVACPIKLSGSQASRVRAAPALGEHTLDVLSEVGYSDSDIKDLEANHVVVQHRTHGDDLSAGNQRESGWDLMIIDDVAIVTISRPERETPLT